MWSGIWQLLEWPTRAAIVFLGHFAAASVLILAVWAFEQLVHFLWDQSEPMFYGVVPVRWIFDTMHVGVLAVFTVRGLFSAYKTLSHE